MAMFHAASVRLSVSEPRPSSDFQREDYDIYTESSISVFDAILGTSIKASLEISQVPSPYSKQH